MPSGDRKAGTRHWAIAGARKRKYFGLAFAALRKRWIAFTIKRPE